VRPTDDETAVLAAMDRYLAAISANDLAAMASMQTPDGMSYRARALASGGMEVLGRPNSYWVDPSRKDGHTYRERYWSPTVPLPDGTGGIAGNHIYDSVDACFDGQQEIGDNIDLCDSQGNDRHGKVPSFLNLPCIPKRG